MYLGICDNMIDTKLLSYIQLKESKDLGRLQKMVYTAYLELGDSSDREVANHLGIERTTVIARRHELMKFLMVKVAGIKKDQRTKKLVKTYKVYI